MSKSKKCSRAKETFCDAMIQFDGDQYGSGRRIFTTKTFNVKTKEHGVTAAYAFGRKAREYVWLNYCPWCGGDLFTSKKKGKK
jgi:hypothetical protein